VDEDEAESGIQEMDIVLEKLVQTVVGIRDSLPADDVGVIVGNYGEGGAVEILGPGPGSSWRGKIFAGRGAMFKTMVVWCGLLSAAALVNGQTVQAGTSPLAACGDDTTSYDVSRGSMGDSVSTPDAGKATVYIVEPSDMGDKGRFNRLTIRHGLDGAWLGATQGFTYLSRTVDPGVHHLCSRLQSHLRAFSDQVSLNNFEAEAGKRYYFRVVQIMVVGAMEGSVYTIDLQPVSEDEGRLLVSEAAVSLSKKKS
jgi:hypothetical protein